MADLLHEQPPALFTPYPPSFAGEQSGGSAIAGVVRGVFAGVDASGLAVVDFAANPTDEPLPAVSVVRLSRADIGKTVMLAFENGDPSNPVIVGLVRALAVVEAKDEPARDAVIDGERTMLTASREIVLRCGEASLTLTSDGRVQLRGRYVVSRASDVNRIQGGSVHIN